MKRLLPLVFFTAPFITCASHLAGGEFQIKHVTGFKYRITLILYFDIAHGNPGAKDPSAAVRIFRSSDNTAIQDLTLSLTGEQDLEATLPVCITSDFNLEALYYSAEITLDPAIYNHPSGYYIAWERCCRNYTLDNIYSEDPGSSDFTGKYAGQTFLMHFPPVVIGATPFVNSSPRLLLPTIDWATIGKNFVQDFSAVDDDGDSLVYSLIAPLSTHSQDPLQPQGPGPKPYPNPLWKPGYSVEHFMQGNPDLKISDKGLLTVTATESGTFAFAVRVEEYRNKAQIGEVIRDFQFLALPGSFDNLSPALNVKLQDGSWTDADQDLSFLSSGTADSRCLTFRVTDLTAENYPFSEKVELRAISVGANPSVDNVHISVASGTLTKEAPTMEFSVCFDKCPPAGLSFFRIGILALDDECSIQLTDTVYINVSIDVGDYCQTQTIDFPQPADQLLSDGTFTVFATATSGLSVTFSTASPIIGSINSSLVTFQSAGRATIQAEQAGNEKYFAAPPVTRSFCVNPLPPVISLKVGPTSVILESTSSQTLWYKNGTQISEYPAGLAIVTNLEGEYTARVVADGCLSELSNSILVTGLDEPSQNSFSLFPNPAGDYVTIKPVQVYSNKKIEISNIHGNVLVRSDLYGEPIFIGDLGAGIYFVKVQSGDGFRVKKFFKK